jgi:Protein of unknown function (DUF2711)
MQSKPPFEADHNCICTFAGTPILKFYKDYFNSVYIILHPFYKMNDQDKIIQIVSWAEVIALTGFKDINQLDIALRNNIGGLISKWKNDQDVELLKSVCKLHNLQMPYEGIFQEALVPEMLLSFQEQGHHYIFVADEFGFERKVTYLPDFIEGKEKIILEYGGRENWYTNKNEILYTVHWDSYFTLLCSNKATVESILHKHPFEGFYCDDKTEIYWSCRTTTPKN